MQSQATGIWLLGKAISALACLGALLWLSAGLWKRILSVITFALMVYGLYLLWKLGKGVGRLVRLIQAHPKAGWSVIAEFFVWGSGWFIWQQPKRGAIMIVLWVVFGFLWWLFLGASMLFPILLLIYLPLSLMAFTLIGIYSARALLHTFDIPDAELPFEGMVPQGAV